MIKDENYFDVVISVYEESEDGMDYRVDSHLLCGGFDSFEQAEDYINTHDCAEYNDVGHTNLYTEIEIEEHHMDGTIVSVTTID